MMEYIEGKTIATLIFEQGPMPWPTAVRLVREVAKGLEHAHRKGLIHRDVNPYNILVTNDGTAKLADLGLAIAMAEEERFTRDGATVGTFDYCSRTGAAFTRRRHPQRHLFVRMYNISYVQRTSTISRDQPAREAVRAPVAGADTSLPARALSSGRTE